MPRANQLSATAPVVGAVLPVAKTALDAGQLETARRLYRRLLDVDPHSFEARMGLGEVAYQRRDGAQAMRWFVAALANATTVTQRHDALLHHGRAALESGQLEHAQASFARLTDPQEAASNEYVAYGLNGVGLALLLSGNLRSSVTLLEQAVERLPGDKKLRGNLARALKMLAEDVAGAPNSPADDPASASAATGQATPTPGAAPRGELQSAADRIERAVARFEEAAERLADAPRRVDSEAPPQAPVLPAQTPAAKERSSAPPAETPESPAQTRAPIAEAPDPVNQAPATIHETPDPVVQTPVPAVRTPSQTAEPPSGQAEAAIGAETRLASMPRGSPGFLVVEGDRRFVQMGAYGTAAKAHALAERLRRVTEQSVTVAERGGLHRVRIGPLQTQDALRALAGALEKAGYGDVRMTGQRSPRPSKANEADAADKAERDARKATTWKAFPVRVDGETFLQIGAFAARDTAMARATELRGLLATPVRVVGGTLPSGNAAHRVRVGPLRSDADLAAVADALAAAGRQLVMPKGTKVATSAPAGDAPSPASQPQDAGVAKAPKEEPPPTPPPAEAEAPPPETSEAPSPSSEAPMPEASSPAPDAPATAAPQQTPTAEDGAAAAVEEVVEAALAAAEQIATAESEQADPAEQPLPTAAESPSEPPVFEETVLPRVRAEVITQDEGLFIQVGDYHAQGDAGELASRLRALTAEAVQVVEATSANAPVYRIHIGPVETDADYEALSAVVASLGFEVH